ncbi:MAG: hypothetical protein P0121_08250 [Nitrospira sp.]|nr:hypothetical protein [Nitrospira sp.]
MKRCEHDGGGLLAEYLHDRERDGGAEVIDHGETASVAGTVKLPKS